MDWPGGQSGKEEAIPGEEPSVYMAAKQGHAALGARCGWGGTDTEKGAARRLEEAVDASCAARGLGMTLLERQVGKMASSGGKAGAALRSLPPVIHFLVSRTSTRHCPGTEKTAENKVKFLPQRSMHSNASSPAVSPCCPCPLFYLASLEDKCQPFCTSMSYASNPAP